MGDRCTKEQKIKRTCKLGNFCGLKEINEEEAEEATTQGKEDSMSYREFAWNGGAGLKSKGSALSRQADQEAAS